MKINRTNINDFFDILEHFDDFEFEGSITLYPLKFGDFPQEIQEALRNDGGFRVDVYTEFADLDLGLSHAKIS